MLREIKEYFYEEPEEAGGVFWDSDAIYMVKLKKEKNIWEIAGAATEQYQNWGDSSDSGKIIEQVKMYLLKNGLSPDKIAIALPKNMAYVYEKRFPAPSSEVENTDEMLRLDMMGNSDFATEDWWFASTALDADRLFLLGAVEKEKGTAFLDSLVKNGLTVAALSVERDEYPFYQGDEYIDWDGQQYPLRGNGRENVWNHGLITALWAAMSLVGPAGFDFLPKKSKYELMSWQKLEIITALFATLFCAVLWLGNIWQLHKVDEKINRQEERFRLLTAEREKMRQYQKAEQRRRNSDEILAGLSRERISYYSQLLNFGLASVDGLSITELNTDEAGNVAINGKSDNYETVSSYLALLNEENSLFRSKPYLEKSAINTQGEVIFTLKGQLK